MTAVASPRPPRAGRALPPRAVGWAAAAFVAIAALFVAWKAGVKSFGALPAVAQTAAAAALLFGPAGYAASRALLPAPWRVHLPLFVAPVGAAVSALALTVLGFAQVPLTGSLVVVVGAGAAASAWLVLRGRGPGEPDPAAARAAGGPLLRLGWPAYLAVVIACVGLVPMFRAGEPRLTGANGDAVLAVGVGDFLQRTQPLGTDTTLYVDRMPGNWRSKYPIYYALAGVARLSGLPVEQAFPPLIAIVLALTALGLMLLAFHVLSAGAVGALLVMAIAGLDRILVYLDVGPFYNQMWGELSLAFLLLFALRFVRAPDRGTGALLALFGLLGAFAYPLMLPFPLVVLVVSAAVVWRRERTAGRRPAWAPRRPRLPRSGPGRALAVVLVVVVALPALLVAGLGVVEKGSGALSVILPGSDLRPWNALPTYLPLHLFFGFTNLGGLALLAMAAVIAAAFWGLRRQPREVALALGATLAGALAFAAYFRIRDNGAFFYFKILGFAGPLILALAVVALAHARAGAARAGLRAGAAAGLGLLALATAWSARVEAPRIGELFGPDVVEVRDWSAAIPREDSVLLALPPNGAQLAATFMLSRHPLSAAAPFGSSTFPAVAPGVKADWVLTDSPPPPVVRPLIAGRPRFSNGTYRLYRARPGLPGRDSSTRRAFENARWARAYAPPPARRR